LSLGFKELYMARSHSVDCIPLSRTCAVYGNRFSLTGIVRGTARRPNFSLAIISVTVQLWIGVLWVISAYFNIRNTFPKSGTFLLGHPVYILVIY
jgi:hypothetical protein